MSHTIDFQQKLLGSDNSIFECINDIEKRLSEHIRYLRMHPRMWMELSSVWPIWEMKKDAISERNKMRLLFLIPINTSAYPVQLDYTFLETEENQERLLGKIAFIDNTGKTIATIENIGYCPFAIKYADKKDALIEFRTFGGFFV